MTDSSHSENRDAAEHPPPTADKSGQPPGAQVEPRELQSSDSTTPDESRPWPDNPLEPPEIDRPTLTVLAAVVFEAGLGLVALALGWFFEVEVLADLEWTLVAVGQGAMAVLPLLLPLWWCSRSTWSPCRHLTRTVRRLVGALFCRNSNLDLFSISAAAGLGEELLFRGFLQRLLVPWVGDWAALILASLLFGLAHPMTRLYLVLAALMGGYLGLLWLWTGNLLVPIVAHGLYDFVALLFLLRTNWHASSLEDELDE